ncbi:MAG: glycosyltransferase family 4 protein, partial [Actinomycetota bacterium]|nr:glycosyltransferase family 4 protein [Actinomycetota bacterium]
HRWRTARLFARATHVVALWPAGAAAISRLYGVPAESTSCIPNARPSAAGDMDRAAARSQFDLPLDVPVVAWVGAMSDEKRPALAIAAIAATAECWLLMAGEGALVDEVRVACGRELPHRHRLVGVVTPLEPVWAAADVVLLTSSTEGMPGVLIEAALQGVPAVATDVGAVASVIDDGTTGRLVAAGASPAQLAAALAETIDRRAEWGAAAAVHARAFTWPDVLPHWVALLGRVRKPGR